MDSARREEIRQWLIKSRRDLEAARLLSESEASLQDIAVYHCQQSAEKALKAYLTYQSVLFPKTHDLDVLLSLCLPFESSFRALQDMAEDLTPYATMFRYPGNVIAPGAEETEEALKNAESFFNAILSSLPNNIFP